MNIRRNCRLDVAALGRVNTLALALLFLPLAVLAQESSSPSFRIQSGALTPGSARASSPSFGLSGCIENGIGGTSASPSFSMSTGCASAFSNLLFDDDDGDGVYNGAEDTASNGGDGNADGIPDRFQVSVASFPTASGSMTVVANGTSCTSIGQASRISAPPAGTDPGFDYPVGLLDLTIRCTTPGVTSSIQVIFHGGYPKGWPPADFRGKRDSTLFFSIPGATYGTVTIPGEGAVPTVSFSITDGGAGDLTPVDGIVHVIAGPAADLSQIPATSHLILALLAMILVLTAIVRMRWS